MEKSSADEPQDILEYAIYGCKDDTIVVNIDSARNTIWKWLSATILSICLFVEIVRERQFLMKDLLEICGLMNPSYWFSYLTMCFANGVLSMLLCVDILTVYGIFDASHFYAYSRLLLCYILGSSTFGMTFAFVVPRSEYYGLPIFVLTVALAILEETSIANVDAKNSQYLLNVETLPQAGTHDVKYMSFRVKEGEVLSFLGSNGAGKSTTMKMLCGTLDATNGDALVLYRIRNVHITDFGLSKECVSDYSPDAISYCDTLEYIIA